MSLITDIQKNLDLLAEQHRQLVEKSLKEAFGAFFEAHPLVKTIAWYQYVPSFNDGDPCEFTIGEVYFLPGHYSEYCEDGWDYEEMEEASINRYCAYEHINGRSVRTDRYEDPRMTAELAEDMRAVESIIQSNDDLIQTAYGSNSYVLVSADDIVTGDYYCDY